MRYPFIALMAVVCIIINSCKRDNVDNISTLLTSGYWQLASVRQVKFLGDTQLSDTTTTCDSVQTFTFNKDKTCTFVNFGCAANRINGSWSLNSTKLFLMSDLTAPDSTGKPYQPFGYTRISNLGDYSLVLETGDIQNYYNATDRRTLYRWGFVRIKTSTR